MDVKRNVRPYSGPCSPPDPPNTKLFPESMGFRLTCAFHPKINFPDTQRGLITR